MTSDNLGNIERNFDLESSFSFEKSEYMTPSESNEAQASLNHQYSASPSGEGSSVYSEERKTIEFNREDLQGPNLRHVSDYSALLFSDREQSIAEPVSITVVGSRDVKAIHPNSSLHEENNEFDEDAESVRKLNTMRSSDFRRLPNYSYSTTADAPIPPRSSKRPKSELLDTKNDLHKGIEKIIINDASNHRKHQSLSLNDDLDKLMLSARSISLKTDLVNYDEQENMERADNAITEDLERSRNESYNSLNQETMDESYGAEEPTGYALSVHSNRSYRDSNTPELTILKKNRLASSSSLPPRPSAENIQKARRTSSHVNPDHGEHIMHTTAVIDPQEDSQPQIGTDEQRLLKSIDLTKELSKTNASELQKEETYKNVTENDQEKEDYAEKILNEPTDQDNIAQDEITPTPQRKDLYGIVELANSEYSSFTTHSPKIIENPIKFENPHQIEDDSEYYDIVDEQEVVHKPSRAKSVKKSTQNHKSKPKTSKTKKNKNSTRPFSYSTLISLLESTNGTIVGEEFSELNLPIREKQLIEKIVDSLSRLTLEMVLDEQRYDVGIQRLEKALRALEGFL